MALPPIQIYQFEDQLEQATQGYLLANGVNNAAKQRDYKIDLPDGTVATLKAPRVEVKHLSAGLNQQEHYYIAPTGQRWLDIAAGTLYLKIVTRRDDTEISHGYWRGLCRYLMQNIAPITAAMKYHKIEKMIESSSTVTTDSDRLHDISALSFQVWLRIRNEFFPVS